LPSQFSSREPVEKVVDITDYLRERIAEVRLARLVGEAFWAFGACVSVAGLFLKLFLLIITGFPMMFAGLLLSVHYELQLRDYIHTLENFAAGQEK
jgi:hypothetical protein